MAKDSHSKVYKRISRYRWQAPILALILVLIHQLIEHTWLIFLPTWRHFATQMAFYGIVGPLVAWWALTSLREQVLETEKTEQKLRRTHRKLKDANQRLEFLIRVNRRLSEEVDEDALVETILDLTLDVVPALG